MTSLAPDPSPPSRPGPFWTAVETVMILAFITMLGVMFVQVTSRYALGIGVPWTDETSRFLYIAQIFLGVPVAQRYGAHIRITIMIDPLPPRLRRVVDAIGDIVILVITLALVVGAYRMMQRTSGVLASTLPVSMAMIYGVQGLGILLYALLVARDAFGKLRDIFGKGPSR